MTRTTGLILFLFSTLVSGSADGQSLSRFGIRTGVNLAWQHSSLDLETSPRVGYHTGVYYRREMRGMLTWSSEVSYSVEGSVFESSTQGRPQYTILGMQSTTTVHALNMPVLVEWGNKITVALGGQLGWLLAADNTLSTPPRLPYPQSYDLTDKLHFANFSVVGGVGFYLGRHFEAAVRYNLGITPVFENFREYVHRVKFRSRVLQGSIGYSF